MNPAVFLSAVRRSGQTTKLDRFVITKAFEALATTPGLSVSINISGSLFGDETYCEFVESMLANSGIAPDRVLFEITENELIPTSSMPREPSPDCKDWDAGLAWTTSAPAFPR